MQADVLIVGAGPAGLALALTLDKFGISFKIVEQKEAPDQLSKAMLVVPGTLAHYSQLGFADDVWEGGITPHKIVVHQQDKQAEIDLTALGGNDGPYSHLLTYPQDEHERLLIDVLKKRGHSIQWQTAFKALKQQPTAVQVEMETEKQLVSESFRYVVGADGGSSAVRQALDLAFAGEASDKLFFVADVALANDELAGEVVHAFFLKEDFLLCFPLRNQTTKRLIGIIPRGLAGKESIEMQDLTLHFKKELGLEITKASWFSEYKVHHRLAESYRKGNVFLIGDAAHLHSPIGGQGMNAGIADAVNLGWKLAHVLQYHAPDKLLETYEEERKRYAQTLISTTDRAFKFVTADSQVLNKIRNHLVMNLAPYTLNQSKNLGDRLFQLISQTNIQYKRSTLNAQDVSHPLLGKRPPYDASNAECMHEMIWHVQVYGSIRPAFQLFLKKYNIPYNERTWESEMKQKGFLEDTAFLARPDGYIAWISEEQDETSLKNYIEKWKLFQK